MIIELPDGTEIEAPDGLPPEKIKAIVQKHSQGGLAGGIAADKAYQSAAKAAGMPTAGQEVSTKVRKIFDPTYPSPSADIDDVAKQLLLGLSLAMPGVYKGSRMLGGAMAGGMFGLGTNRDDLSTGEGLKNAALSVGLQATGGGVLNKTLGALGDAASKGLTTKSPQAKLLESQGVKGLTVGQSIANPETSALAALEAASTKNPLGLAGAREAAKDSWRASELAKTVKKGEPPLPGGMKTGMAEAYERFGPQYDAIRDIPVSGETFAGLPEIAQAMPKGIDDATRNAVRAEVKNAMTILPKGKPEEVSSLVDQFGNPVVKPAVPPRDVTAGDMMKVREYLREQARAAVKSQDFDRLRLLDHAEDAVTGTLEKSLTPEAAASLREIDSRYAKLMTLERASPAGQTDFTPGQLLRSAEHSMGRRAFKQGQAGTFQQSGEAARDVFAEQPFTGGRVAVLSAIPGGKFFSAPLMRALNTEAGKKLLFGGLETPALASKIPAGVIGAEATPVTFAQYLAKMLRERVRFQAAPASEEDR